MRTNALRASNHIGDKMMTHPHLGLVPTLFELPDTPQHKVVSMFSGIGGMDMGFLGGFDYLGKTYDRLPLPNRMGTITAKAHVRLIGITCTEIFNSGEFWKHLHSLPKQALFIEYWGESVPPENRIAAWLRKADKLAKGWKPSEHLFKDYRC